MVELEIDEFGSKEWFKDDKLHRLNGPAIEIVNGRKEWLLNGKKSQNRWTSY